MYLTGQMIRLQPGVYGQISLHEPLSVQVMIPPSKDFNFLVVGHSPFVFYLDPEEVKRNEKYALAK